MKLSQRLTSILPDGTDGWELFRKARAEKAAGRAVIELTLGEHDIRTDPAILQAMHDAARGGHTGYASIPGILPLRRAAADRVARITGVPTGPDNILITAGGQAALFFAHHAACDDGARALYIDPFYATYPGTIRTVGAVPVAVRARADRGFQPLAADLAAAAPGAQSLLINTPNNPTGAVYTEETLGGIARVVRDHDLWLISDEVYDSQVWEGRHRSPRALPDMAGRTLVLGSLSKSHAMTGSRIGWVCGPVEVIDHLSAVATTTNYGLPGFIQDAGLFALGLGPAFETRIAEPFRRRRLIAARLLAGQNLIQAAPMQGAMYAMLDIRATGLTGTAFAERLLKDEAIAVMPGESFGSSAAGHVRVALTVADAEFEAAFARLLAFAGRAAESRAA
jgi:arginine:pyruvate transaminase